MVTTIINSVGSGKDYSTLAAWWTDVKVNDVITRDRIYVAEVYGQLTDSVNIADYSYSTSSTNYFHIRAASGQEFDGDFSDLSGKAGIACTLTEGHPSICQIQLDYTRVSGLYLKLTSTLSSDNVYGLNHTSGIIGVYVTGVGVTGIKNTTLGNATACGIEITNSANRAINCFVDDIYANTNNSNKFSKAYGIAGAEGTPILNCTVINVGGSSGSSSEAAAYNVGLFKNCLGGLITSTTHDVFRSGSSGSDYNASDDTTSPGSHSLDNITISDEIEGTTAGSAKCTLKNTADCVDEGANLESTYGYDDDIAGNIRGIIWDIGASEYILPSITWNGIQITKLNGVSVNYINGL